MTTEPKSSRAAVDRYGPWVALYAAIALTASGEFELASLVGFPGWIAWALPTAIDVYVIQAIRRHRDVAAAILLMVATNAIYHLAAGGLFGVTARGHHPLWWLIVGVAAIAPLIVWRVHRITEPRPDMATEVAAAVVPLTGSGPRQNTTPIGPAPSVNLMTPVATEPDPAPAPAVAPEPTTVADKTPTTGGARARQNAPATGDSSPAKTAAGKPGRKRAARPRANSTKAPRRSLTEWVEVATPIYHAEFAHLRRQPTANEFATAIETAGHGRVSDSTAKNIRTEILDRTELPALD